MAWYVDHSVGLRPLASADFESGSCLHALVALRHPRWEDFNYESEKEERSRLHWLGDGSTYNEKHLIGDREWVNTRESSETHVMICRGLVLERRLRGYSTRCVRIRLGFHCSNQCCIIVPEDLPEISVNGVVLN